MSERLEALERVARRLDPDPAALDALFAGVERYAREFLADLPGRPVYVREDPAGGGLESSPIGEGPIPLEAALALVRRDVDGPGINPASGRHMGYIPGGGVVAAAFGDFMAGLSNRYAGVFFADPGAVRMENLLLAWMAGVVGYPPQAAGNLTSGGSIANLIGVVTARDAHGLAGADLARSTVYLSPHAHHSVGKALRIAGLAECPVREVALDEHYRMRPQALAAEIASDRARGMNPWLVVAAAGTTDTGAVDPLAEIGAIARDQGLWFHVDGAYGAFFALCEPGRRALTGMETSDSITMDPHKSLFLPYGSGAVLVKNARALFDAHRYTAAYLQDALGDATELSPADLSPELSKHFRGLRLWLPLKLLGLGPFRACLEEKMLLARRFHERLAATPGFEVGPQPDLSVVTYRYLPRHGDPDAFNRRLVEAVRADGRVFVSSTMLDGRFTLRLAVLVFRTHRAEVDLAAEVLTEKARELERG